MVRAGRILGSTIMIYGTSLIILGKELLHFPIPLFCAYAEFKILFGDGVPVLVRGQQTPEKIWTCRKYLINHHDGQQIAYRSEEQPVKVMRDGFAKHVTEDVEDHLANNEEKNPEGDISKRPSILQCIRDQYDLHDQVDEQADAIEEVEHDEETQGIPRTHSRFTLESQDRHRAR